MAGTRVGEGVRDIARLLALLCLCATGATIQAQTRPGSATGTLAGTPIVNTAGLLYDRDGQQRRLISNTVTVIVAERLDVRLVRDGQGPVVLGADPLAIPFVLTNADNGSESFAVAATLSSGGGAIQALVIDTDGDGRYDPTRDTPLAGGVTPVLAPGETLRLLVVLAAGSGVTPGETLTLTARSTTGSGNTGTPYDGKGDGGGDAVVGPTGAAASVAVPLLGTTDGPILIKSQSVLAGDGSADPGRGAVVTYTLEARFPGATRDAAIADAIPAGTAYLRGTLILDGAPLTDAADADPGTFDGAAITVALGDVAAVSTHTVQFKALIQ